MKHMVEWNAMDLRCLEMELGLGNFSTKETQVISWDFIILNT
jgi:hypothetical protein